MPRALLLLLLVLGAAACSAKSAAVEKLRSRDPAEVAWGAYLAGTERDVSAIPELIERLSPARDRSGDLWQRTRRHVLDALILLDARVPPALLEPLLAEDFDERTMALILLSREPERNREVLLRLFAPIRRSSISLGALVAGNLLCRMKSPEFVKELLPRERITLHVTATDDPDEARGRSMTDGLDQCAGRYHIVQVPPGFPPEVIWNLVPTRENQDGETLLADGPLPVCRNRRAWKGAEDGKPYPAILGDWYVFGFGELAPLWLIDAAGLPADGPALGERLSCTLLWTDQQSWMKAAGRERDAIVDDFARLLRRLRENGILEDAEGARPLTISVEVRDERKDRGTPLPGIPAISTSL